MLACKFKFHLENSAPIFFQTLFSAWQERRPSGGRRAFNHQHIQRHGDGMHLHIAKSGLKQFAGNVWLVGCFQATNMLRRSIHDKRPWERWHVAAEPWNLRLISCLLNWWIYLIRIAFTSVLHPSGSSYLYFFFLNYLEINRWVCFCGSWCKSCWIEKNYFRGKKKCFKMCLVSGERKQIPEEGKNQNVLEKNCHRQLRFLQTKEKQIHWKQKSEMRSKSSPGRHLTFVK